MHLLLSFLCIGKGKPEIASSDSIFSPGSQLQLPMWSLQCESWKVGAGEKLLLPGGSHRQLHMSSIVAFRLWKAAEIVDNSPRRLLASVLTTQGALRVLEIHRNFPKTPGKSLVTTGLMVASWILPL